MLIADEVGLGKTISAGLILRQAILRGLAKRVLILTPKSVQIQWQNELYERFNLNVPIYDGSALIWKPVHGARSATEKPVARDEWQAEPVVLVSSFLMRRADRQRELIDAADWDLITTPPGLFQTPFDYTYLSVELAGSALPDYPASSMVSVGRLADQCEARNRHRLAPRRFSSLLALSIPATRRPAKDHLRNPRTHPPAGG